LDAITHFAQSLGDYMSVWGIHGRTPTDVHMPQAVRKRKLRQSVPFNDSCDHWIQCFDGTRRHRVTD